MRGILPPFDPLSGLGLDLGVDPREINAGVSTSHLRRALEEQMLRSAGSAKKVEPTKLAAPSNPAGVKTSPATK